MDQMNRLLRGLPDPAPTDAPQEQQAPTASEWFDRVVLGRQPEETEDDRDSE